jgi:hypothetical protein
VSIQEFNAWVFHNVSGVLSLVPDAQGVTLPPSEGPWAIVYEAELSGTRLH